MIWETSQRPLLVKTVWVGGYRHAILSETESYDIGLSQKNKKNKVNSSESINEAYTVPFLAACVQKLSPKKQNATKISLPKTTTLQRCGNAPITPKTESTSGNPLSERVLQWLDLAGQEVLKCDLKTKLSLHHSLLEMKEPNGSLCVDFSKKTYKASHSDGEQIKCKYVSINERFISETTTVNCKKFHKNQTARNKKCFVPDPYESRDTTSSDEYDFDNFDGYESDGLNYEFYEAPVKKFNSTKIRNCDTNYSYPTRKKLHIFIPSPQ